VYDSEHERIQLSQRPIAILSGRNYDYRLEGVAERSAVMERVAENLGLRPQNWEAEEVVLQLVAPMQEALEARRGLFDLELKGNEIIATALKRFSIDELVNAAHGFGWHRDAASSTAVEGIRGAVQEVLRARLWKRVTSTLNRWSKDTELDRRRRHQEEDKRRHLATWRPPSP
jgi:hypothetical protein